MSCLSATRSDSALPITDRLQGQSAWRAESPNIPHGWLAEEATVFAIELAGTFVSDLKSRTGGIETIQEHQAPRCLQPKLLLILKRTHGGQSPEMMVQRGHAHTRDLCEIFHSERLSVVRPHPRDRFCCPVALISQRCNASKARPLRPPKDSVNDLALNQAAQKRNVPWGIQQVQEPATCIEEFHCGFTGRHGRTVRGRLSHLNLFPAEKFPNHGHFEFQRHRQTGRLFTGLSDLADYRQIERRQQVSRLTVGERSSSEVYPLSPLGDHGHARLVGCGTGS